MSLDDPPEGTLRHDNFGNAIANPMTDLLDVPGHHDYTPERLRLYANGSRVYLQYGTDSRFTETNAGRILAPNSGDTLTLRTGERISYAVGYDLVPSFAWGVNQALQSGDVVAGGYGDPDVDNFDPVSESYSGSSADGYFWILTEDTALDELLLVGVRNGTIFDKVRTTVEKPADIWGRFAQWINWYDVGPCRFIESYTDVDADRENPQQNDTLSSVANDDGKGPLNGSKRARFQIHQDSANSGLELEVGSIGVSIPGRFSYIFKDKEHTQTLDNPTTSADTYEVLGAIRGDPNRPLIQAKISDVAITRTPSTGTSAELLIIAVDPDSTNFVDGDFSTPQEHSPKNSIIETAVSTTATGPDAGAAGTDSTGAETAETLTNQGGYQIGRDTINQQGTGSKSTERGSTQSKSRRLYDGDWALLLLDSDEAGTHDVEITTAQNA